VVITFYRVEDSRRRSRMDRRRDGWRGGFININDMYNNDVGQGVVYAYEAYEAK